MIDSKVHNIHTKVVLNRCSAEHGCSMDVE